VNQTSIGRTTRSNPASYVGAWNRHPRHLREGALAKERDTPRPFQLQLRQRALPTCGGNGFEHVEMQFLSDVYLAAPTATASASADEVLEIVVEGKSMRRARADRVEALAFFR